MNGTFPCIKQLLIIGFFNVIMFVIFAQSNGDCPRNCRCDEENAYICENLDITKIPSNWPTSLKKISIKNSTLNTIEKNSFRRYSNLEEIYIEHCSNLDLIDKYAFKGLSKLRLIYSIYVLDDHCFEVESCSFASISKVDFLKIKGICAIQEYAFQNTTRIHNLIIWDSSFELKRKVFAELHHVNQIQIQENKIERIGEDAFMGTFTVGSVHIQNNKIGQILPRAFSEAENLGTLVLSYNTIREPLEAMECLLNSAQKFVFTENTLHCTCSFKQWIELNKVC